MIGCTTPATQLVVAVDTDLAVPEEVATVVVRLRHATGQLIEERSVVASSTALPLSFGVVPPDGDADATVLVEAEARDAAGAVVVVVTARTGFVAERSLLLRMLLQRSCRRVVCGEAETCVDGACESDRIDPTTLPPVRPGEERDSGRADTGTRVDGGSDASLVDAGDDAGSVDAGDDAGSVDAGDDAGSVDAGSVDAGDDAGRSPDGGESDAGTGDGGAPDAAVCAVAGSCDCPRDASCAAVCRAGEVCVVDAQRAASFVLRCESGSRCTVDCSRAASCVVDCAPGAACLVDCVMGTCSFASCESAPIVCPPRLTCGVACP